MPTRKLITMKIQIIFMVAMETKIIIVTMTAKQPHFASSENVTKWDFHYLLSPVNRVVCE